MLASRNIGRIALLFDSRFTIMTNTTKNTVLTTLVCRSYKRSSLIGYKIWRLSLIILSIALSNERKLLVLGYTIVLRNY